MQLRNIAIAIAGVLFPIILLSTARRDDDPILIDDNNSNTGGNGNGTVITPPVPIDPVDVWIDAVSTVIGSNSSTTVRSIEELYAQWQVLGDNDNRKFATILSNAWTETNLGFYKYELPSIANQNFQKYEPPSAKAAELGNTVKGEGFKYRGHGLIQITGKENFRKFENITGRNLVDNPTQVATDTVLSAFIAVFGMVNGSFTGVRLSDFFNNTRAEWFDSRKIVNGLNKAGEVSQRAKDLFNYYNNNIA